MDGYECVGEVEEAVDDKRGVNPVKYFLAGGFAGVCTVLVGHPLDTIKVRLQTMPKVGPGGTPLYTGVIDCARKTIQREGVTGLYKGMTAPLMALGPIMSISFFAYGIGQRLQQVDPKQQVTLGQIFIAGSFSGIFTTTIMAPGERIKCLLQIQQGGTAPPKYLGTFDAIQKLYKEGGIRSIYKGTVATLLRDVHSNGVYFMTYELIQRALTPPGSNPNEVGLLRTVFAGGCSGLALWLVAMPADVIKSRLQTAPEGTYTGLVHVFRTLMKEEGPMALYKGITPVMLRAFPANAACFMGFETAMKFLNWVAPDGRVAKDPTLCTKTHNP